MNSSYTLDDLRRLPPLLDVAQVADITDIQIKWVYRLCREGRLPGAVLLGSRRWKVRTGPFVAWLLDGASDGEPS